MMEQRDRKDTSIVLDEIISHAAGLPADTQYLLLMMAKAMRYTRECLVGQVVAETLAASPKQSA